MSVVPRGYEERVKKAVSHYWRTLGSQASKQRSKAADRGKRAAVTGGKQMDGFCELVNWVVRENGMPDASVYTRSRLQLPGFFRPTKKWDLIVVHGEQLVAAVEFKSQAGSFGNNLNNRTEEALGNAVDLWTGFREGAFGEGRPRPWVGWVMLLEDCPQSTRPVGVAEPHFKVFPEFRGTSYAKRYELLLRKLVLERHYDGAALIMSTRAAARSGRFREPAADLTMRRVLAGIGGHVQASLAAE
ncbi:MAG: PaeR7I family type II restriction endonuclease [Candidatus Binatia bacterium]